MLKSNNGITCKGHREKGEASFHNGQGGQGRCGRYSYAIKPGVSGDINLSQKELTNLCTLCCVSTMLFDEYLTETRAELQFVIWKDKQQSLTREDGLRTSRYHYGLARAWLQFPRTC